MRPDSTILEKILLNKKELRKAINEFYRRKVDKRYSLQLALEHTGVWLVGTVITGALIGVFFADKNILGVLVTGLLALLAGTIYRWKRFDAATNTWLGLAYAADLYLQRVPGLSQSNRDLRKHAARAELERQRMHHVLDHLDSAVKWLCRAVTSEGEEFAIASRRSLVSCVRFFSSLAKKEECPEPRAGIIVRSPSEVDVLIPLVVYVPGNETYVSTSRFDYWKDFSGFLLHSFASKQHDPDALSFSNLTDWIPDTHKHVRTVRPPRFRFVESHHNRVVSAIFGNIIYRRENGKLISQGALNLDSELVDGLDAKSLEKTRPQQRPVFRIMNLILDLAVKDEKLFNSLYQPYANGE